MKLPILVALATLPWLAVGAEAHSGYHRYHHHGYHHHYRSTGWHHHRYRHGARTEAVPAAESTHDRSASVPEQRSEIYAMVTRSAIEHGLPPSLAHGIVRVESGYRCTASHAGAMGIMQIKSATARSVGVSGSLSSCQNGLEAGMRYLRQAYDIAHGNASYAATLYNRGLGARPSRSGYSRSVKRMSSL